MHKLCRDFTLFKFIQQELVMPIPDLNAAHHPAFAAFLLEYVKLDFAEREEFDKGLIAFFGAGFAGLCIDWRRSRGALD